MPPLHRPPHFLTIFGPVRPWSLTSTPKTAEPSITHPVQFKLPSVNVFCGDKSAQNVDFLTTFSCHNLRFEIKILSVHFCGPKCTKVVNLVKFPSGLQGVVCTNFGMHTYARTHGQPVNTVEHRSKRRRCAKIHNVDCAANTCREILNRTKISSQ